MYGSWLPSVSTQTLYGFGSQVQFGVLIGVTVFQGVRTGQVRVELPACSCP